MSDVTTMHQQHAELVNMFIRLNEAVKNNESRQDVYRIIDDAIAFTRSHFANEEQLMVKSGYPEIEAHKKMHEELIEEALQLKGKFDYVEEDQFIEWLNHWPLGRVRAHIQYADKQLEDHINQNSMKI
jgi:hemerythrin-like metal-binding protein